jgi:hypothetical protein
MSQLRILFIASAVFAAVHPHSNLYAGTDMSAVEVIDDRAPSEQPKDWSLCDVFDYSTLYKGRKGINKISLIGRYHGQLWGISSNQGNAGEFGHWENRRLRAGLKMEFLDQFVFEGQFNLNVDGERFFNDVEDLTLAWEPNDDFYMIIGKQKAMITREWSQSSKRIKTIERSQLVNQTVTNKVGGVVVGYHLTDQIWAELGGYTLAQQPNLPNREPDWALPEFNGGYGFSTRIGYQPTESTEVRLDWLYMDQDPDNFIPSYHNIVSLNTESYWDDIGLGLVTDLIFADGVNERNSADAFSLVLMPTYMITDKLEAVFRYTFSTSESNTGIRLQRRHEREAAPQNQRGSDYHAFYFGLNYYICEDHLKVMSGVEHSDLESPTGTDFRGWTYWSGVRLYF